MLEKIKRWNWKLILSIFLALVYLSVYLIIGILFDSDPDFKPFMADSYEPSNECLFGFGIAMSGFFFGLFLVRFWKTMDMIFPPKKRKAVQ